MDDIIKEIEDYHTLITSATLMRAEAQNVSRQAGIIIKSVQDRIKGGETTRDRIKDFVIARYGFPSEEIEAIYRRIEDDIRRSAGEFILVITKDERRFSGESYVLVEDLYLGMLNGNTLLLTPYNNKCASPTGSYIISRDYGRKIQQVNGSLNLGPPFDFFAHLDKPLKRQSPWAEFQTEPDLELEIKIGDSEVRAWFNNKRDTQYYLTLFRKMAEMLGRPDAVKSPKS